MREMLALEGSGYDLDTACQRAVEAAEFQDSVDKELDTRRGSRTAPRPSIDDSSPAVARGNRPSPSIVVKVLSDN